MTQPVPAPLDTARTLSAEQSEVLERAVAEHEQRPGALLPVLHALQDDLGYVPAAAIPAIASQLNLSRAEVHGVVSFYHHFRSHPPGRHVLAVCRAEACQSMGAERLAQTIRARLGVEFGGTTTDGEFTLEPVYCLGNCACAPAVMLDGEVHGRIDEPGVQALLDTARTVR